MTAPPFSFIFSSLHAKASQNPTQAFDYAYLNDCAPWRRRKAHRSTKKPSAKHQIIEAKESENSLWNV